MVKEDLGGVLVSGEQGKGRGVLCELPKEQSREDPGGSATCFSPSS